jgi:alpha-tubulin suppressor-like RCC1 family protein
VRTGVSERRFLLRYGVAVLVGLTALVVVPIASSEQASSKAKRLPAGSFDAGDLHTCALLATGAMRCWGEGDNGRLGYGNTSDIGDGEAPGSVGPVNLGAGRRAVAVSAGTAQTCAILDTGGVRCWGWGSLGRLGYGNTSDIGDNELPGAAGPVNLGTGRKAIAISAGGDHTCAILDTGAVRCWGRNDYGQLGYGNENPIGDNETPASVTPVDLGAGRRAVAISAGTFHTCAILDNGRVRCWGAGLSGRLGYGNTNDIGDNELPGSVGPVDLGAGRKAVAMSAGGSHTCALLDNGRVRCWGGGGNGRLGYGNTTNIGDNELPGSVGSVDLGAGRKAVAISTGTAHNCALLDNGRVRCWGYGLNGALGYGNTSDIGDNELPGSVGPVDLGAGRTAVAIAAGQAHSCALLDNGEMRCWGLGLNGRLGYGNTTSIGDNELPSSAGPVSAGGPALTKLKPKLSLTLKPKRDRTAPYKVKATGKLTGFLADSATCSGKVVVKAKHGKAAVTKRPALKLGTGGCTYTVLLMVKGTGNWKVSAKFAGNGSLLARSASARTFRAS